MDTWEKFEKDQSRNEFKFQINLQRKVQVKPIFKLGFSGSG